MKRKRLSIIMVLLLITCQIAACGGSSDGNLAAGADDKSTIDSSSIPDKNIQSDDTESAKLSYQFDETDYEDTTDPVPPTSIIGRWECSDLLWEDNGRTSTGKELAELYGMPIEDLMKLDVYGDNTAVMDLMGMGQNEMKWKEEEDGYVMESGQEEETPMTMKLEDGKLIIIADSNYESDGEEIKSIMTYTLSYKETVSKIIDGFNLRITENMESKMCHMTNGMNRFLIIDDKIFGSFGGGKNWEGDFQVGTLKVDGEMADIVDRTVLMEKTYATYLTKYQGYIYGLATGKSIFRMPLSTLKPETIYEGDCDYFQIVNGSLYFTDENAALCKLNPDGSGKEIVLDHTKLYYTYFLTEDWLIYQDDPDNETLHIRNMKTGKDLRLTDNPSYVPFICGNDLFYLEKSGGRDNTILAKVDLSTGKIERDERNDFKYLWINMLEGDKIIIGDGALVNLERKDWDKASEVVSVGEIEAPLYTNGEFRIVTDTNNMQYIMHSEFVGLLEKQTKIGYP